MKPRLPQLVERITTQIQGQVSAYAGPRSGRRRRLIEQAVTGAVHHFVGIIEGRPGPGHGVDELFRRMGRGEALDGHSLQAMREAYRIATRDAWAELHQFALTQGLTATVLGKFGDELFSYMDHLTDEVSVGYRSGRNALDRDTQRAHEQLLAALLTAADFTEVQRLASIAAWPLPTQLVVFAGVVPAETPLPDAVLFESDLLARIERPVSVFVCDAAYVAEARREAWDAFGGGHLAVSWPVSLDEVSDALRWTRRALELAQLGVLEADGVINCEDHLLALWLYAEPRLRQRVCHDLLAPLLAEAPHNREVLSATLLAWLETHDSAPVLAEHLGVHPQTVRYRQKRLLAMFGDQLTDPDHALAVVLALKASIPLWAAGHLGADLDDGNWRTHLGNAVPAEAILGELPVIGPATSSDDAVSDDATSSGD